MVKMFFSVLGLCYFLSIANENPRTENREYYQLKTYIFESDSQVRTTDDYLENTYLPALKRMGIHNVGVFKSRQADSTNLKKTYVLIPFKSLSQFEGIEDALSKDLEYLKAGDAYINAAHDRPPYKRIESVLLRAFVDMPVMKASKLTGPRAERIYELRSYEGATEEYYKRKVDMFNAGGEIKLFDRLNFNAVFYGEVISGGQMPNLMYLTTHKNQQARDANWKAFFESPEWEILKIMPKYKNTVSRNEMLFLYPTEYSDY